METLTCSGSFCLSLLLCALVSLWLDLTKNKASREGRGRSRRALLLLPPLLLFSSFSFGSNSCSYYECISLVSSSNYYSGGKSYFISNTSSTCTIFNGSVDSTSNISACTNPVCTPSSGEPVVSSGMGQNGRAITGNFCDSSTGCVSSYFNNGSGYTLVTSGSSCDQCASGFDISASGSCVAVTASAASTPASSCPSGYSLASGGCSCVSGSTYVAPSPLPASCTPVGNPTAPVLSPVAPVTSNGVTSCPSGSATVTSGSSTSCYDVVYPPAVNNSSTPSSSAGGGSGGNSSFHLAAPTVSSNGQLTCPPGASTIGSGSSLECVVSGPGGPGYSTSPTASGSSGTSPTSSTASAQYPTSFSMPTMPTASINVVALSQIASARESTSLSCPSPVTFDVMNHTFSITFTYACQLAAQVRPVVIGVFSMASLLLIVK
ncbi:virulence factor TspB C-terminal domain-related protein [Acidithiobacillus ferriphilus]|uniref:virulence factor TspB C-terminal domain-related protein n=1 Tax=Acidithiobacillus ferriphilus TaxID=1689834 RepID=UPI002DB795F2|nr:virulence factor TspB C-terminal domain-related protein [Acidithiobacillus ferriphilus]MEB8475387.1 virulence factor TspB C-terminal domain-related protein [Acidithiobacillus ferriphilus]